MSIAIAAKEMSPVRKVTVQGFVFWWKRDRGFGVIKDLERPHLNYFAHIGDFVRRVDQSQLKPGVRVTFMTIRIDGQKPKWNAYNIRVNDEA